jgi:hypothetical protein
MKIRLNAEEKLAKTALYQQIPKIAVGQEARSLSS